MATYIKTLKEDNGDITYPQTKAGAVLLNNGSDLETELSQYVTAEDIASTSALTPPVQTNMIADGAVTTGKIANNSVTSSKIDWTTFGNKWVYMTSTVSIGTSEVTVMSITCSTPGTFLVIGTVDPNFLNINPGNFMCAISVNGGIKQSVYANSSGGWFMGGMTVQTVEQLKNGDVVRLVSSTAQNTVQVGRGHMAIIRVG